MVDSDEISVKGEETTEISHIDITFITVLMTVRVWLDQKFNVFTQIEKDIDV